MHQTFGITGLKHRDEIIWGLRICTLQAARLLWETAEAQTDDHISSKDTDPSSWCKLAARYENQAASDGEQEGE